MSDSKGVVGIYRKFQQRSSVPQVRVNGRIKAETVRTIDKDGNQAGIMLLSKALDLARASKLDLVEVAPNARPPVCRIMDFGKYQYLQMKKNRLAKKKQGGGKLKEIKIRPRIEHHDYEVKLRHAKEFLTKGNKLRIRLIYRGRELAHKELGNSLLQRFAADLQEVGAVESPPKTFGKNVVMLFAPQRSSKARHTEKQKKGDTDAKVEDKQISGEEIQNNEKGES
jgi:translation initiation factor IF-3